MLGVATLSRAREDATLSRAREIATLSRTRAIRRWVAHLLICGATPRREFRSMRGAL